MKKITLLISAVLISAFVTAQTTLSHSTSQVATNGSVACASNTPPIFTQENSYWRTYTPANFGFAGDFVVTGAEFGWSYTDRAGNTPSIDVTVNIYSTTGTFPTGVRTLLATQMVSVGTAEHLTVVPVTFTTPTTLNSNSEIVVQLNIPSGETAVYDARVGQNGNGENAPSYLSSTGCGGIAPTPIGSLGTFPNSNIIINLVGDSPLSVNENDLSSLVQVYPNPATSVLNLKVSPSIEVTDTILVDVLGKTTDVKLDNGQLNISGLARGIYMLQVITNSGTMTKKIIKQ